MKALASLAADLAPLRQRNTKTVRVLLVSTYELGRQPFGLASPAACLRADGHQVTCTDLAVEKLSLDTVRNADLIALLHGGQIVELGTHDELLSRNGYYTDLYNKQLLEEELAEV